MKKHKIVLVALVFSGLTINLFGQRLYFVGGQHSDRSYEQHKRFPTLLFSYNIDALIEVETINDPLDSSILGYIEHNVEAKAFFILERSTNQKRELNTFKVLNYHEKPQIIRTEYQSIYRNSFPSLLYSDSKGFVYNHIYMGRFGPEKHYGITVEGDTIFLPLSDFRNIHDDGMPACTIYEPKTIGLILSENSGSLFVANTKDISSRPKFSISYPHRFSYKGLTTPPKFPKTKVKHVYITANTSRYFITHYASHPFSSLKSDKANITYLVFDKESVDWFKMKITGSRSRFRVFGDWLAGSYIYHVDREEFYKNYENKDHYPFSPGYNQRTHGQYDYYLPFDEAAEQMHFYFPGTLFLYYLPDRCLIEIPVYQAGQRQGDSEILMVENNHVIYRINDEIWTCEILENQMVSKGKLLVKDHRVPSIHWAFYSN